VGPPLRPDRVVAILMLRKDFDRENKAIDHLRRKTLFADSLKPELPCETSSVFLLQRRSLGLHEWDCDGGKRRKN